MGSARHAQDPDIRAYAEKHFGSDHQLDGGGRDYTSKAASLQKAEEAKLKAAEDAAKPAEG